MTTTILESGQLRAEDDCYVLDVAFLAMAVRATLHGLLASRPDRLAGGKDVAQIGAAIGRDVSHALMKSVAGIPEADLCRSPDRLA